MKSSISSEVHAFRTSRFVPAKFIPILMLFASTCLMQERLFGQEPAAPNEPAQAASASISGNWRTEGTFSVSVRGTKVMGGDGPVWVNFKKNGSMTTEMDFPFRWSGSGRKLQINLDKKKVSAQLGTPSAIRYARHSLTVSGSKITGKIDCTFSFSGQTVHWVWKFTGRK